MMSTQPLSKLMDQSAFDRGHAGRRFLARSAMREHPRYTLARLRHRQLELAMSGEIRASARYAEMAKQVEQDVVREAELLGDDKVN